MVEIVPLRGWQEREVVATVIDGGAHNDKSKPKPAHGEMRPSNDWPSHNGSEIDHIVLKRVAINGTDPHWSSPFMVHFVDVPIKTRVVEESRGGKEGERRL